MRAHLHDRRRAPAGTRPCPAHSASSSAARAAARASASSRSTNRTPSRWSVSCWMARASSSRALDADRVAVHVPAGGDHVQVPAAVPAVAGDGQAALGRPPRSPRRPASTSGLTRWPTSPSTYQVKTRRPTPICGAARPAPPGGVHGVGQVGRRAGAARRRSRRPGRPGCAAPGRRTAGWGSRSPVDRRWRPVDHRLRARDHGSELAAERAGR